MNESTPRVFVLAHQEARRRAADYIARIAQDGWMVRVSPPSKRRAQEERYHAMIDDIAAQCLHPTTGKRLTATSWKRLLVEAMVFILREEARGKGDSDPFPEGQGAMEPSLDGLRIVQVEVLTREFTIGQASAFIEYLFAFGAEHDVRWSNEARAPEAQPA